MAPRVLLVEPRIPTYRAGLWPMLGEALSEDGIHFSVVLTAQADTRHRGDMAQGAVATSVPVRAVRLGRLEIVKAQLDPVLRTHQPTHIIVEQSIRRLENYQLLRSRPTGTVAAFGHGDPIGVVGGPLVTAARQWQLRRSGWFFAYTDASARSVKLAGYPADRTTVVNNSIDTAALRTLLSSVTADGLDAFRAEHHVGRRRCVLFLGTVDQQKGVDYLLEVAAHLDDDTVMLFAGAGNAIGRVRRAAQDGLPVVPLGRIDGPAKAVVLRAAELLVIPQAIGLVAVDALVAGLPVLTLDVRQPPEAEYLRHGGVATFLPADTPAPEYARAVGDMIRDPELHNRRLRCEQESLKYGFERTVAAFRTGISRWVAQVSAPGTVTDG